MKENFNIANESFIPDGLEFRQEYLDNALNLYKQTKRKLWWKKFYFYSGVVALVLALAIWSVLSNREKASIAQHQNLGTTIAPVANPDQQKGVQTNTLPVEPVQVEVKSEEISGPDFEKNQQTAHADNKQHLKSGISRTTFDLGDSGSSGSELPDQGSKNGMVSKGSKNLKHTEKPTSIVLNTVGDDAVLKVNESSYTQATNDDEKLEGSMLVAASRIEPLQGNFFSNQLELKHANVIPVTPTKKWKLFAAAGITPLSGYGSNNNQWKPDPIVTAGLEYSFHKAMAVSIAGRYLSISGLSHPIQIDQTTYGQGFSTSSQTYFTDRLHYGGIGLSLSKKLNVHHHILLGYGVDYLITGNNHITSNEKSSFENRDMGSRKDKGFIEGFQTINHSLHVGYQYWFTADKSFGLTYQLGLTDITKDAIFVDQAKDKNSMLSIYFRMNLTK